ncbi:unnamed protein product [Brassica rapa subsp. trilocularis]
MPIPITTMNHSDSLWKRSRHVNSQKTHIKNRRKQKKILGGREHVKLVQRRRFKFFTDTPTVSNDVVSSLRPLWLVGLLDVSYFLCKKIKLNKSLINEALQRC